ncbi:MAG: (2Fe-2S)-binding protein [Ilumatobacteraceae bacterium]
MAKVCECRNVSERKVVKAIDRGATTIDALRASCNVARQCGMCIPRLEELIAERAGAARPVRSAGVANPSMTAPAR